MHAKPIDGSSVWSVIAPISATVAVLGVLDFNSLSLLAGPAALVAIFAGTLGVVRDRRTGWRVLAGLSALAALGLVAVVGLMIYLLSGPRPT
jgi:hypothetical protein